MRSFSILRTHTGLSTNVKVMVDSKYNLYLESISSVPDLDLDRFKKMQFNKSNYYDELVPYFFKNFPVDIAFSIKYDSDNDNMSVDFANQYDDIYLAGARNIVDNKNYTEEYEYFAPLYVFKHALPKYFLIFRIDGPGLLNMTKDNFRTEFLDKFKTVKLFDLTKNTVLGEWMDNNFSNNPNFPVTGLEIDFNELEFSKWNGIDYDSGGYTYKSFYLEENLENENNLFDFEKLFLDGYRVNKTIFPHIINFSYLFDDTPANPTSLRKWSLNRYAGFYLDELELIDTVTPFVMPELHSDVVIYGTTGSNTITSTNFGDPFKNGWRSDVDMWVEYLGEFYRVVKFEETLEKAVTAQNIGTKAKKVLVDTVGKPVVTKYKIVTDLNLSGKQSFLNKRTCYINSQNQIVKTDGTPYFINNFTFADVNLINIDGKYHNIVLQNGYLTLVTDYGFKFQENNTFEYYINSGASGFSTKIDLFITNLNSPKNFKIYRAKFTDVKDFDTFIVDTEFSKFEYEKRNDLTKTEETKMYLTDLRSQSSPQDFDDFIFKGKTELVPVASDYTANLETFRIEDKKLTDLWRKNPIYCRWGYQNSRSAHDYPYLLNNNDVHEKWNRTVDTQNLKPERSTRNLDYFYTVNSGTTSYLHHSLHIEKNYGDIQDTSFRFELDKYLELGSYSFTGLSYSYGFSYFDLFFAPTQSFIDGELILNKKKYSWFEQGDNVIPNTTLFRGLKFRLFEVDTIKYNSTFIENINLVPSNLFSDYKFSILLSSNDWMVNFGDSQTLYKPYFWDYFIDSQDEGSNLALLTSYATSPSNVGTSSIIEIDQFYPYTIYTYQATASNVTGVGSLISGGNGIKLDKTYQGSSLIEPGIWRNKMQWQVIKSWEHDVSYNIGDFIIYEDVVFRVLNGATVSNPIQNPINLTSNYQIQTSFTQFWNYSTTYTSTTEWVYRFEQYYKYNPSGTIDFWNPNFSYLTGQNVMYYDRFFEAATPSFSQSPNLSGSIGVTQSFWKEISSTFSSLSKWKPIELWNKNLSYNISNYVVNEDILYVATQSVTTTDDIPGSSNNWQRIYSFIPDTSFNYGPTANSIIQINDSYYYCKYNPNLNLDSGITIYINKKWKNVLVNIAINDNTIDSDKIIMDETRNLERDSLYVETNGRLTAANFIRQINDLDTLYGFVDYTSYVIIEEDGSFKRFNFKNDLDQLPYLMICEEPDPFELKNNSLRYKINTVDKNVLKPSRFLVNGQIDNLEKIDFYNDLPLGVEIQNVKSDSPVLKNYNSQRSIIFEKYFRHSGYYMPIFYEIELFTNADLYDTGRLCEAQFVLDVQSGQTEVTFYFEAGDLTTSQTISVAAPVSNTPQDWEDFYQQVIDVVQEQEIFSNKVLSYEIYEPGNENIHPQITPGYYVLSIKYDSPVCDLRLKATEEMKTYCLTISLETFSFTNPYGLVGPGNSQIPFILQLIPGPFENGEPTYGVFTISNGFFSGRVYFTGTRWEITQYTPGPSEDLIFFSNTFEGLFTANYSPNNNLASISEGSCNSICVTGDPDLYSPEESIVSQTFILVDQLYNGKNFYSGDYGTPSLIRWEPVSILPNIPEPGWYLVEPVSGHVFGYVTNTSQPIGTFTNGNITITFESGNCPLNPEAGQFLSREINDESPYDIPLWILGIDENT